MSLDGRFLIVNADDFGHSRGVNTGVIKAHEHGIVTSASLMVRWPAAVEAAAYARGSRLGLGLHVDLGEWVWRDGSWAVVYEVVPPSDAVAVAKELERQLDRFRELVGHDPSHLDSHQHVHVQADEPTAALFRELANSLGIPLRHRTPGVRYRGDLYAQTKKGRPRGDAITLNRMLALLADLPPGVTELGCHPAEGADIDSAYREERQAELELLCHPLVLETVGRQGIELRSFADLPR